MINEFEDSFNDYSRKFVDFRNSAIEEKIEKYSAYSRALEKCLKKFHELITASRLDYDTTLHEELRRVLTNEETKLSSMLTERFRDEIYSNFVLRVQFYCSVIVTSPPHHDLTVSLVAIGDILLKKPNWGYINMVLDALSHFNDETALDFIDCVVTKLVKQPEYYYGELGDNIYSCVYKRIGIKARTLAMKYENISIDGLATIFTILHGMIDKSLSKTNE